MRAAHRTSLVAPTLALLAALTGPGPAVAETYVVDRGDDPISVDACTSAANDCSLRGAVDRAQAHGGPDTIVFDLPGTFRIVVLTHGQLVLSGDLVVDGGAGEGVAILRGGVSDRVVYVTLGAHVTLRDLVVANGEMYDDFGGGIYVYYATLSLERVEVTGNYASTGGGGIGASGSDVALLRSTVADNSSGGGGGGIWSAGESSSLTLVQSTVSGNESYGTSALHVLGSSVDLDYSTIADNRYVSQPNPDILLDAFGSTPSWVFRGTIVKGECEVVGGAVASGGANVESPGDSCGLAANSDRVGVLDAGLSSLDYFGGATITRVHRPMVLGPAVDLPYLVVPTCGSHDQRGLPRMLDGDGDGDPRCDAGAVELQPSEVVFWDDFESGDTSRWSGGSP